MKIMDLAKAIGLRLKKARKNKRLTQEEVGKALGIGRPGYANIENGRSLVTVDHLLKLPAILGQPITSLLGLDSDQALDQSSDSDKINAIYRALQAGQRFIVPPDLAAIQTAIQAIATDEPKIEYLAEIWDALDAYERRVIWDYVCWRFREQEHRRNSSDRPIEEAEAIKNRYRVNIESAEFIQAVDRASPEAIERTINYLHRRLQSLGE